MTYAPQDLIDVRKYALSKLNPAPALIRDEDLEPDEVGIVGDRDHAATGGYHEGEDDLVRVGRSTTDYSVRESSRDRAGLDDAASAIDFGEFTVTINGRTLTLRSFSAALVAACRTGDPRTRDIREIIWSPDGKTVLRWDRLGIRSSGDSSHLWHTHISFFRDSEGRRNRDDNFLGLLKELVEGDAVKLDMEDIKLIAENVAGTVGRGTWTGGYVNETFAENYRGTSQAPLWNLTNVMNVLGSLQSSVNALQNSVNGLASRVEQIEAGSGLTDADRTLIEELKKSIAGLAPGV